MVRTSTQLIAASQEVTQQQDNVAITSATAGPIMYDLNITSDVGSNNNIKYTVSNVLINASLTGYKSITITVPQEFAANYTLPASWTEHISGNTINFIISRPSTTGTVAYITNFLEKSFAMTLTAENVFPSQVANLTINISENFLSSRSDGNGVVHYYEYISANNVNWLTAYNTAKTRTLNGLAGYLVTITSQEEQDFIYNSIAKTGGWLGSTRMRNITTNTRINDEPSIASNIGSFNTSTAIANDWYWADGPEAGTVVLNGAIGSNYVPEQFNFWTSGEPNNAGGSEYVMMFAFTGSRWNDQGHNNFAYARGYYVEYGGYPEKKENKNMLDIK